MSENFKTYGDALTFCKKYKLAGIPPAYPFVLAEALLRAYKDGKGQDTEDLSHILNNAIYDIFAYRLGPDEWEEAEKEFQNHLQNIFKNNYGKI